MSRKKESAVVQRDGQAFLRMEGGYEAKISPEDAPTIEQHHWRVNKNYKGVLYVTTTIDRKLVNLNHFLTGMKLGANTPHRNGNALDFRRENLDTLASSISVESGIATMKIVSKSRDYNVLFDEADVEKVLLSGQRWSVINSGYVYDGKTYFHRFLLDAVDGVQVDHLNQDKLDNRRSNLVLKTPKGNASNRPNSFATPGQYAKQKNPYRGTGQRRTKNTLPPVEVDGDKAYLQLTQGQVAIIDASDAEKYGKVLWLATWNEDKQAFYAKSSTKSGPYLHQVVMDTWGMGKSVHVDHINGNTLDCRRENLRITTPGQNAQNRGAGRNSKTGVRNVYRHEITKQLEVKVMAQGKGHYGGFFPDTPEGLIEATEAARLLREKLFTHSDGR